MNIYVGNLSYDTKEDGLRSAFEAYGEVASVSIITDRDTGRSRGLDYSHWQADLLDEVLAYSDSGFDNNHSARLAEYSRRARFQPFPSMQMLWLHQGRRPCLGKLQQNANLDGQPSPPKRQPDPTR